MFVALLGDWDRAWWPPPRPALLTIITFCFHSGLESRGPWMPLAWRSFEHGPVHERGRRTLTAERGLRRGLRQELALRESRRQNELLASVIEHSSQAFGMGYPDGRWG